MNGITFDIGEIADLATDVAVNGAIAVLGQAGAEMFEATVGIIALIYEMYPNR